MKLMRIFVIGLMIIARPAVAADKLTMTPVVVVPANPEDAPESALSPHHSPHLSEHPLFKRDSFIGAVQEGVLQVSSSQSTEEDDDSPVGTTATFAGHLVEDQLKALVDEYVKAGNKKKLQELRETSKERPENIKQIIQKGLEAVKAQEELDFQEWFHANKNNPEELRHWLPAHERHSDATRAQRIRAQLALLAQAAPSQSKPDITKTVEERQAFFSGGQLHTSDSPLAASQVPLPESPRVRAGSSDSSDSASSSGSVATHSALPSPVAAQAQPPQSAASATQAAQRAPSPAPFVRQEATRKLSVSRDLHAVAHKPQSIWKRAAWFGVGTGVLAVAAAAIYYFWINPHYQIIKK